MLFLTTAIIIALLSSSYLVYIYSNQQQNIGSESQASSNWEFMNHDSNATNFNPQTLINPNNVNQLRLAWLYPFPSITSVPGLNVTGTGSITPPLVVNGIVYLETNYLNVIAFDASSGSIIWTFDADLNTTGLPLGPLDGHIHGINYYEGKVWLRLPDCTIVALDALTGNLALSIPRICAGIPGNAGKYDTDGTAPVFLNNILITGASVSDGSDAGRGFVAAYNISDGSLLWRWFIVPPAGGNPNWDSEDQVQLANGTIVNYGSPSGNVAPYSGDWGSMGYNGNNTLVGGGLGWGQFAIDASLGLIYVGTTPPRPGENATFRQGPNLYSDSIVALNITSGKMKWFFQTTPHDLYNFGCGWNVALGSIQINGTEQTVVFSACKNGYLYALNANTGRQLWLFNPPAVVRSNTENANYTESGKYNATEPWTNYPSNNTFIQCPGYTGGIEADIAVAYGEVYIASYNFCISGRISSVSTPSSSNWGITDMQYLSQGANTTIYAVNAATGKETWSYFIANVPYRGWLTVTGGMVLAGSIDGNIYMLNAKSGNLVSKMYLGTSLYTSPTIGSDISGNMMLFELVGSPSYGAFEESVPGDLLAFSLPNISSSNLSSLAYFYISSTALAISLAYVTITLIQKYFLNRPKL
jgi:glucose dehydrogenase